MPDTDKGVDDRLTALLQRRYRGGMPAVDGPWNETLDALLSHRSVRAYLPKDLPDGTLELLVAAAQSASSSSNLQCWSVIAIADPDRKARMAELAGPNAQIGEAPLFLIWIADLARARAISHSYDVPGDGLDYVESFLLAALDAALAAQNAVLAAESLSLGTCYVGAVRNKPDAMAAELGLPPDAFAVFGMTVGIPDPDRPTDVKPRLPQASVLHREHYGSAADPERLAIYNAALREFQAEQSMAPRDWTEQVSRRIGTTRALHGREQLREALHRLGFKLR